MLTTQCRSCSTDHAVLPSLVTHSVACRYLSFVQGIVDSDTLPLQVSRESLQQHDSLKTIKKKLVRKALDMIKKLADAETAFAAEDADSKPCADTWVCVNQSSHTL